MASTLFFICILILFCYLLLSCTPSDRSGREVRVRFIRDRLATRALDKKETGGVSVYRTVCLMSKNLFQSFERKWPAISFSAGKHLTRFWSFECFWKSKRRDRI